MCLKRSSLLSSLHSSKPSISGILVSERTRSGGLICTFSSASLAVDGGGDREAGLLQADLHHAQALRVAVDEQEVLLGHVLAFDKP